MAKLQITYATRKGGPIPSRERLSDIEVITSEVGRGRNERALKALEFDMAEVPFSYFLLALERGKQLTALPYFPYRHSWQEFSICHEDLKKPEDLKGKRVVINRYENTAAIWFRGDIWNQYQIALSDIHWLCVRPPFTSEVSYPQGVSVTLLEPGVDWRNLLERGDVDAALVPNENSEPEALRGSHRLFTRDKAEDSLLHIITFKKHLLERFPKLPAMLLNAFAIQKVAAEEKESILQFLQYSLEQGIVNRRFTLSELFPIDTLKGFNK